MTDITVTLRRGDEELDEWTVDGPDFSVRIPTDDLEPGEYKVTAGFGYGATVGKFRVALRD